MLTPGTHKALDQFAKKIVKNSKQRLSRKNSDTRNLEGSIGYDLRVHKQSFSLSFQMLDYGTFVDEGVRGKESSARAPKSPYRFKDKKPPIASLRRWSLKRGLNPFAVQTNIFKHGLKATNFFTIPFEKAFDQLPDMVMAQFSLDVDEFLEQVLNT